MGRHVYLDNLKVVLIAAIIALHAIGGYAGTIEGWTYTELREVTLAPLTEITLVIFALPFGLSLIALLFLVSGLLTVPSMDRKGPGRFALDRLVRLGIPFAGYVLLIQVWLAAAFAALEAVLCLFGSVWLLGLAQRRLARPVPRGPALARSAYGAFILQTPVLIGLALALRGVDLPAELKALAVAVGGVAGSFALAWLLVARIPGVDRVL